MKNQIILMFLITINLINANIKYTPENYYNLESLPQNSSELYYPDICNNTIPNSGLFDFFMPFAFGDDILNPPYPNANLLITKDTKMESNGGYIYDNDWINILCIEGSLEVLEGSILPYFGAIVILPGGSLKLNGNQLKFKDLIPDTSKIDPFSFFPGLLALGGSLIFKDDFPSLFPAIRISNHTLFIPDLVSMNPLKDQIKLFSEIYTNGQTCSFKLNDTLKYIEISSDCLPIPENDGHISVYFFSAKPLESVSLVSSISSTGASFYITGDTTVHFENYHFSNLGKTQYKPYNDTQLTFSPNDSNTVTEILIGNNQRNRNSLFIEFSNNSTITGCLFEENKETMSPLAFYQSKIKLNSNLIGSVSGSSVIVQNEKEVIQSSNNAYYLTKPKSLFAKETMGSGYEGNGIYSVSANILSSSDKFIGHSNAFNFDFKSNNESIYKNATTSFNIKNTIFSFSNQTISPDRYLVSINSENPSNYIFNDLTATEPIKINLQGNSTLKFNGLIASNRFSIDGEVTRLDITNSKFISNLNNQYNSSKSLSLSNSYVLGETGTIKTNNHVYGSNIVPFYYNDSTILDQLKIASIYPNVPLQMGINNTLNVVIKFESTALPITQISCAAIVNKTKQVIVAADSTNNGCSIPIYMNKEGSVNLRIIVNNNANNQYLYSFDLPEIIVYNGYSFYYGLRFTDPNVVVSLKSSTSTSTATSSQTIVDGNLYQNGCQQQTNCSILSNSNNIKYQSNLPSVTGSNELNELFLSGITTTIPNEAINFNLQVDSNINLFQIQLFFIHVPNNQQTSPLSIYIQEKPYYLLEPLNGVSASLKNTTFTYENINSLNTIKIGIVTNGDIYLTSLAAFSIIIPPIVIPTIPPITPTPTETPSVTDTPPITDTPQTTQIPSEKPTIIPTSKGTTSPALVIGLSVGLSSLAIITVVSLVAIIIRYKRLYHLKREIKMKDIESNKDNVKTETPGEDSTCISSEPILKSPVTVSTTENTITLTSQQPVEPPKPVPEPLYNGPLAVIKPQGPIEVAPKPNQTARIRGIPKPTVMYSSFPTLLTNNMSTKITYIPLSIVLLKKRDPNQVTEKYVTHPNIIKALGKMKYFAPNDPFFPLKFNTTIMDIAKGKKSKVGETIIDILQVTNTSSKNITGYFIFPVDNHTGIIASTYDYFHVKANSTADLKIAVTLTCTTNYFQNFAIVLDGFGYTLITIHLESELSAKLDFGELEFDEFIAEGTFGVVLKGVWRSQVVAIKILKIEGKIMNIDELYHEMDILSRIRSKYVIGYIGGIVSEENFCIVTEYIDNGSLGDLLHKKKYKLTHRQKVRFALDICRGMEFIHQSGIIHRDIKPDNLLVVDVDPSASVCIKISDFGTCKECNKRNKIFTKSVGTPIYMSSEMIQNKQYDKSTDVYSFGITLYEIMTGIEPFSEFNNEWEIPSAIVKGKRPILGIENICPEILAIIEKSWADENRPTFGNLLSDLEDIFKEIPVDKEINPVPIKKVISNE